MQVIGGLHEVACWQPNCPEAGTKAQGTPDLMIKDVVRFILSRVQTSLSNTQNYLSINNGVFSATFCNQKIVQYSQSSKTPKVMIHAY